MRNCTGLQGRDEHWRSALGEWLKKSGLALCLLAISELVGMSFSTRGGCRLDPVCWLLCFVVLNIWKMRNFTVFHRWFVASDDVVCGWNGPWRMAIEEWF